MKCTCGPHPHINLTAAYSSYRRGNNGNNGSGGGGVGTDKDTNKIITSCRQIQSACMSHGCFHVTISLPNNNDSTTDISTLPIDCLSKPIKEIEEDIESLFVPKFLQNVIQPQPSTTHIDCNNNNIHDDICNGGLVEVLFPTSTIIPTTTNSNNGTTSATFRGRVAESGDGEESKPEPKLSWEYQRCALGGDETTKTPLQKEEVSATTIETDDINKESNTAESEKDTKIDESSSLMPSWTEALHSVASTIVHLLDIPSQLALQEESCQCLSSNTNNDASKCQRCNIDLLRVFRYDAISSPVDSPLPNNDYDESQVMGSSPHSDWGTMTIVWQDNKGGLQTYCHACDIWSDVDVSSSTKIEGTTTDEYGEESSTTKNNSNRKCLLFVHIGDFLSLASIQNEEGNDDCYPMWPSPRHRVLCPTLRHENNTISGSNNSEANAKDCRRSLVYFAYPPPNISLDTVQKVVSPIISSNYSSIHQSTKTTVNEESSTNRFYNHYSLLHNQSKQSSSLAEGRDARSMMEEMKEDTKEQTAFQAYQTIKNLSFGKVIKDKWNQVQR